MHEGLYFRPRADESVTRQRRSKPFADNVQPIHYFVTPSPMPDDPDSHWVTAIVIANPIHDLQDWGAAEYVPYELDFLRHSEELICALRDHHPYQDGRQYTYRLTEFEHTRTSDVTVCRPVVDWDRDDDAEPSDEASGQDRS